MHLPFPQPVVHNLWIERYGPGHKVDPTNHSIHCHQWQIMYHPDTQVQGTETADNKQEGEDLGCSHGSDAHIYIK